MKRVMNESAAKRCLNCRRPKGDHNRVQGLVLCPRKNLGKFHPMQPISTICYAALGRVPTEAQVSEIRGDHGLSPLPSSLFEGENPLREPTGTADDLAVHTALTEIEVMNTDEREIEEDVADMISEGSPV